eukprot:CAMPEP_0115305380 /NCGR_PEP_ID=MMETSP0270-20121206/71996_1 /TAXON_ID=71861 /ORGANISM="Scrippsiella trochoidea, Strain CCMP3099" /LENGTH=58 /DNA_ID=CAMNT_0002723591 /DNA_START=26 /DNA_END=199 /DNA_ORIENTATION=+
MTSASRTATATLMAGAAGGALMMGGLPGAFVTPGAVTGQLAPQPAGQQLRGGYAAADS